MKLDSVTANFGGENRVFKIARDDLPAFELYADKSAYSIFRAITESTWLVTDLKTVLRFASMPTKQLYNHRLAARVGMTSGSSLYRGAKQDHIDRTFAAQPVAQYAALAMSVLAGAMFGIEPADATFDDGVALGG